MLGSLVPLVTVTMGELAARARVLTFVIATLGSAVVAGSVPDTLTIGGCGRVSVESFGLADPAIRCPVGRIVRSPIVDPAGEKTGFELFTFASVGFVQLCVTAVIDGFFAVFYGAIDY